MSDLALHLGGLPTNNGSFNTLFSQVLFGGDDKSAGISSHKYRVKSANTRNLLFASDCNSICCDCCGNQVAPDVAASRELFENGGWPMNDDGTYKLVPIVGLAHNHTLDEVFWQVLSPKADVTMELVLYNGEVTTTDCDGKTEVVPGNELGGSSGEIVLATIDGAVGGCTGDRSGQGLVDLTALGILPHKNNLRFNDFIGLRPTSLPNVAEGEHPSCALQGFGIRVTPHQDVLCK